MMARTSLNVETDASSSSSLQAVPSTVQSNDMSDCEICHLIWTRLTTPPSKEHRDIINLGSLEEALASKRSRHLPLVKMFLKLCSQRKQSARCVSADVGIAVLRPGVLYLTGTKEHGVSWARLLLVRRVSIPNHPGNARILDPEWIDTSLVIVLGTFGLRRRIVSNRSSVSQLGPCDLPSWSLVGWQGAVSVGRNEAGPVNWFNSIQETISITTWYACATPTSAQKRRIRSSWFENRQAYKDFRLPLPPGWTRQEIPERSNSRQDEETDEHGLLYPDG
ncbi:hypothetical protein BDP55DRAFT_71353 [Colletotrichum godetiae]|uniref:Uncharacterized protein n=1 Tax=Colletotrichum godetiae TaxID=1209918 RepID=A0AAJ0EXP8_9PEZI|nr:uncharacterized protein BDP55DRAFT_71353 [Colletotrichum godetiae]KAK1687881.1 hypothetical protein BDP55DRAFT_71353 [Colletotrichum godetiae]